MNEHVVSFNNAENQLIGVLHLVQQSDPKIGLVIIVGGPQTRVGSHRQFVLLSRYLANNGVPSLRFDYTGMGDSQGIHSSFLNISDDIESAISLLKSRSGVSKVVLLGLCDAASSALIYAKKKPCTDLAGIVLLNPWVRSEQGEAKALVKYYYFKRLQDAEFWGKLFSFRLEVLSSIKGLLGNIRRSTKLNKLSNTEVNAETDDSNFIEHMLEGLKTFQGKIMLVISGDDLTAAEFCDLASDSKEWRHELEKKIDHQLVLPNSNHTFSTQICRDKVEAATLEWLETISKSM
jgi:exosortase A-associated hydrolase 1